jgi:3-hydroxyacyl-CoA dehydrogenase
MPMNKIKSIGVIGEGKMGSSILLYLNGFDFKLSWLCSSEQQKETAQKTYNKKTKILCQSGVITESEYNDKLKNTKITALAEDLAGCDLIIEAIYEDIHVKRTLFNTLHKVVNPECIFTSNSSSILPSQLNLPENRRDKLAGLHFFFPVALKNIVELITTSTTSQHTTESLLDFLKQINKKTLSQNETNAFILNRLLLDFQAGAFKIYQEGFMSFMEIDELVKMHLFPVGVFEFFDHVGIDVMLSSIKTYTQGIDHKEFYDPLIKKLEELVAENHLGIKSKHGFYDYTQPAEVPSYPNPCENPEILKRSVTDRLWNYYIKSVDSVIQKGLCTREDLAYAVKDYLGIDSDPFLRKDS